MNIKSMIAFVCFILLAGLPVSVMFYLLEKTCVFSTPVSNILVALYAAILTCLMFIFRQEGDQ